VVAQQTNKQGWGDACRYGILLPENQGRNQVFFEGGAKCL